MCVQMKVILYSNTILLSSYVVANEEEENNSHVLNVVHESGTCCYAFTMEYSMCYIGFHNVLACLYFTQDTQAYLQILLYCRKSHIRQTQYSL